MKFEKKLKNRTIIAVILVLLVLCSTYFSLSLKNHRQYLDWQIQKDSEVAGVEIKHLLYTTNRIYREKIQYFVNNPDIKQTFHAGEIEELYRLIFPYYSMLKNEDPYHFVLNFYTPENRLALNMETGPTESLKFAGSSSLVAGVNEKQNRKSAFELYDSQLFYKIIEPITEKGEYIGCIEFGIRENEIVENISREHDLIIGSIFNVQKISEKLKQNFSGSPREENLIIHSLFHDDFFKTIMAENKILEGGKVRYLDKYYFVNKVEVQNSFKDDGFAGVVFLKDITRLHNAFLASVYRSLLIIFFILAITFLILHFSFNILLNKFLNLQDNIDKRLAKKTREILDTNAELNQIFNTTGNSMRLIDTDFNILRVNRTFTMISGISKEDAEGKKCYNVFPGPYCHTADCPLNLVKNGEERVEQDIKKRNQTGKIIPGILTSVAFKTQNGEILGIIEDFKDISLRVEIEESLRRSEQKFSTFMDNLPLGVFIKDEDLRLTYMNKYMDAVFTSENCLQKTPREIFPEQFARRIIEEDQRAMNGELLVVEEQLPDKTGKLITYQTHKFRFRAADNSWKVGGLSIDISQKKKTEYELKKLSNAILHSPVCVIITNLKGQIEYVNPVFTKFTGYTPEEVLGEKVGILTDSESVKAIYKDIMSTVSQGNDWQGEIQNRKKNGEIYWELASISPVKNNKNEITHFIIIAEDISKRKKNEKELLLAKEQAEESNRLKTAFLANLSHEIRTPLNAIIGFSSLLLDEDIHHEEKVKLNNLINENSQNLLKLIDDVIDISKIQSGNFEINPSTCYVNKLLLDLYVSFSVKIEQDPKKDIRLSMNKGVRKKDFSLITDTIRLKQVLFNIIENAVKFTQQGFVEFGYSLVKDDNKIQFYVIDSGIGIANDKFEMIYDLFRQVDESFTREYGGTGLGLTIAKKIVHHLGGEIWVQSTPKQGTNIYFTLPLENKSLEESTSAQDSKSLAYNWKDKVFLIADDIDTNYAYLKEVLSSTHAKIIWAKDGKEAVDLCMKNKIDLVIMDLKMPNMDGYEATKAIKKIKQDLKIIGQSTFSHDDEKQKCLNAGCDSYIAKPIRIETLFKVINNTFLKN
ncbi:MAG: PAS domain S-box protein [Bacteroidales bacterium]|jgi:PAS domain S-box-containing protein|nr:PAS domain S-box protein [Bacteroidales bacterium]